LERIKAKASAAKEPTAAEIARAKEDKALDNIGTGILHQVFGRRFGGIV
jgi:hypothetical protein